MIFVSCYILKHNVDKYYFIIHNIYLLSIIIPKTK